VIAHRLDPEREGGMVGEQSKSGKAFRLGAGSSGHRRLVRSAIDAVRNYPL